MYVYDSIIFVELCSISDLFGVEEAYKLTKGNLTFINFFGKNQYKMTSYR